MISRTQRQTRPVRGTFDNAVKLDRLLETFQALDRVMVELFMQVYEMPLHRQSAIRMQNRRLHSEISKPLRRILSHGARPRPERRSRS